MSRHDFSHQFFLVIRWTNSQTFLGGANYATYWVSSPVGKLFLCGLKLSCVKWSHRSVKYLCCIADTPPQNKSILLTNPRLEAPLPPFFSCWAFLNSAVTPAVGSVRKCSTRLRTLWCTPCSVAKRQQFSCPLRACLPLKSENVVPYGWICSDGQVMFSKKNSSYEYFCRTNTHIQQNINDSDF